MGHYLFYFRETGRGKHHPLLDIGLGPRGPKVTEPKVVEPKLLVRRIDAKSYGTNILRKRKTVAKSKELACGEDGAETD